MSKTVLKVAIWLLLSLLALGLGLLSLQQLARLAVYFQQGADPATALNIVPNVPPDFQVKVTWLPDDPETGRPMEPFTRGQIEAAYLRAWLQWNLSYAQGKPYGLKSYFVGPALAAVTESVTALTDQGWKVAQSNLSHELTLHFYAADGSIISFTDSRANLIRVFGETGGPDRLALESLERYDVVMFLEDGNWRVRHWVRLEDLPLETPSAMEARKGPVSPSAPPGSRLTVQGRNLYLDGQPFTLIGTNYYPQATPWYDFWPRYDPAIIQQDLTLMASLGLNTVRIFIPYRAPGGPQIDGDIVDNLADFLDRAHGLGLYVMPALFDFRGEYNPLLWPNADRYLETLITRFRDHPAILAWDVKNEPDRDFANMGSVLVNAWLEHVIRLTRELDPSRPITVGWFMPDPAANLVGPVDFVTFHHFLPADQLAAAYARVRAAAGEKPILLGEFGLPTWNSYFFPNGHSETEQAVYYAQMLAALQQTDAVGYMTWTLYDFIHPPTAVFGRLPWKSGPEQLMGVVRRDGTLKPAAALLGPGADLNLPPLPAYARWTKPFWRTVYGMAVLWVLVGGWWLGRQRTARKGS